MSEASIPAPDDQDKIDVLIIRTDPRCDHTPLRSLVSDLLRLRELDIPPPPQPAKRRRRREDRTSGLYTVLHAAQQHGITHPTVGGFLQLPREFDAILALEQKATAQVVLKVLRQTIGRSEYDQHGHAQRREWATISTRDFVRAGLTTQKAAWRGIKEALKKGYIVRREVGAQRYEYAIRWRGTN
jgi:hypothetical protein